MRGFWGSCLIVEEGELATMLAPPWRPARWRDGEISGCRGVVGRGQQGELHGGDAPALDAWRRLEAVVGESVVVRSPEREKQGQRLGGASWQKGRVPVEGWNGV